MTKGYGWRGFLQVSGWLFFAVSCVSPASAGGEREPGRVRAWIDSHWDAIGRIAPSPEVGIRFKREQRWTPSAAEMDRLRNEVRGKPDHPDRDKLRTYENTLKGKPVSTEWTVWYEGEGSWRANRDFLNGWMGEVRYSDVVVTKKNVFALNPVQLTVLDPSSSAPGGYDYPGLEHEYVADLSLLADGGLYVAKMTRAKLGEVVETGSTWRATFSGPDFELVATGIWNDSANGPLVDVMEIARCESARDKGRRWESKGWAFVPELNRWIASEVIERTPEGKEDVVRQYLGVRPAPEGGFASLTAGVSMEGEDPVRGAHTFVGVKDFTGGSPSTAIRQKGEWVVAPDLGSENLKRDSQLRWIGWVTAGLLVAGLVGIRLKRSLGVR